MNPPSGTTIRQRVLLSFDAEEFDIPLEYGRAVSKFDQFRIGATGWERTLHLLDDLGIVATFFTTGAIAQRRPDLVRWTVSSGHEIASHSLFHSSFATDDLRKSREVLREISGQAVTGFRMPRMAEVDSRDLAAAGYSYNSSTNPIWLPGRYNKFFTPRRPYFCDGLLEIPLSATPIMRWPLFWLAFKNQPKWLTRATTDSVLRADGHAALYFHPWELVECTGFGLPTMISSCSGERMFTSLREHLLWLKQRFVFQTYGDFARDFLSAKHAK